MARTGKKEPHKKNLQQGGAPVGHLEIGVEATRGGSSLPYKGGGNRGKRSQKKKRGERSLYLGL